MPLGSYPTPLEPLPTLSRPSTALWVKRDDRTSTLYGGNKVRKLERLLAAARAKGAARVLTLGAVGSHHVLATAVFARQSGLGVEAVLLPQPRTPHVVDDVRADLALGAALFPASSVAEAAARVAFRLARGGSYFIPIGGSNVLGALGYVDAARELAAQVRAGVMPEPDVIVVTLGSGGTAGGLAAGLALEGMKARVLAVTVAEPPWFISRMARSLAVRCARHETDSQPRERGGGLMPLAATSIRARIEVEGRWLGRGYGYATPDGQRASSVALSVGLTLDPTYTAKTFAAVLDLVERGRDKTVLYWHTLSSAPLEHFLAGAPREDELDPKLRRLLR